MIGWPFCARSRISIHALREESDQPDKKERLVTNISIHALREESDSVPTSIALREGIFQSTPSARRATDRENEIETGYKFQSTPSARRATRYRSG